MKAQKKIINNKIEIPGGCVCISSVKRMYDHKYVPFYNPLYVYNIYNPLDLFPSRWMVIDSDIVFPRKKRINIYIDL